MRLKFDSFEVDPRSGELCREGEALPLQNLPFRILLVLLENPGQLVTHEDLKRRVWPAGVHLNFEQGLHRSVNKLRAALGDDADQPRFIETLPGRGYRFKAVVKRVEANRGSPPDGARGANIYSALPVDSPYYIRRGADTQFERALGAAESIILVSAPRQTGKTSLVARGLAGLDRDSVVSVTTDFGKLPVQVRSDSNGFLLMLADELAGQVGATSNPELDWSARRPPTVNFDRFLKKLLQATSRRVIWAIDEADCLFQAPIGNEFFALLRSFHNERALQPGSPVHRLTVVISYAREAHLFISDENQSPFNVGTRIVLRDFSAAEAGELNDRYGNPLNHAELAQLFNLVGGHPLLIHGSLQAVSLGERTVAQILQAENPHDGLFGDHLRRMLRSLNQSVRLKAALMEFLETGSAFPEQVYELQAAGLLAEGHSTRPRMRCPMYAQFLRDELLSPQKAKGAGAPAKYSA
ncbi:MAG: AAA-like domain-containing protein [Acidobacteria bacterium]|nr:AAA-like domain-containing protein [Acidobacteriota bacterium]